ncbi:MAG: prepilin-type N-terminal cleavage/methylation domain-containing protein [Planctomycetota bacterium]|nr:prepilin-type N-terminal cleavage/methylation domain-containing protein [Planctomycetota bacterium]
MPVNDRIFSRGCVSSTCDASGKYWNSGMTLMEVLIVLALISVSLAAVAPNLMNLYQRDSLNRVNQKVTSSMGKARTLAVESGKIHLFRCQAGGSRYEIFELGDPARHEANRSSREASGTSSSTKLCVLQAELPRGFQFLTSEKMSPLSKEIQIRWLPDGTSSGQSFGVGERGGITHWVRVDALTGEISRIGTRGQNGVSQK